jgi:hypothetical protein
MLQDSMLHNPLIMGLIADLYGYTSQDLVEEKMRFLINKGIEIQRMMPGTNTTADNLARCYEQR